VNRLKWRVGTVTAIRRETASAHTLGIDVPDWPGHLPGQHVDVRLTAPDGYQTQRSYSIASAPDGTRVELTVQRVEDGEVSPYLLDVVQAGFPIELRGPVGGWFVWRPQQTEPVTLIAGGSGVVPLMAMIRTRQAAKSRTPFRLLYAVRSPDDVIYRGELRTRTRDDQGLDVSYVYSRQAPEGFHREPGRITVADVNTHAWPPEFRPRTFVCGPTAFVETVADILVALGHPAAGIRTERFG
jgi:ferredoxin-NADP reductase